MTEPDREKSLAAGEDPRQLTRLPAGRHGLAEEFVIRHQRERILTAIVDTVAERGYKATTVAAVIAAAGVSRRTFYEHFSDKDACYLVAHQMVTNHLRDSIRSAAAVFDEWPMKVRAATATVLEFLAAEPEVARSYTVESVAAGGPIAARHREAIQELARGLRPGRATDVRALPEITEETLIGGMTALLVREIGAGRASQLGSLLPELVELILTPYLGADEAKAIALDDPPPSAAPFSA